MTTIDAVRAYWDAQPCNIRHGTAPVGTREFFNQVEMRKYFVEPHIPRFAEFSRWRDKQVLDVGCGLGTEAVNFARTGAFVLAVDISEKALDLLQARRDVFGLGGEGDAIRPRVYRIHANAEELYTRMHGHDRADLVWSFGVLHHTPNPDRMVQQFRRYIADDGLLKLMIYHRPSWKYCQLQLGLAQSEAQAGAPIARYYTKAEARALLENNSFRVIRMEVEHIFPWRVKDYVRYRYVKAWPWRAMPERLFRWLERRIGHHLLVEAVPC